MTAPFAEIRLELGIHYGTVGGPAFNTSVISDGAGGEQRNSNWSQPLCQWNLGNKNINQAELEYLVSFHQARKGAWEGFRFKDWTDYSARDQPLGLGDGTRTQYQLIKTYRIGTFSTQRPITKPVLGTVTVYVDGVIAAGLVNFATGLVTLSTPPALATLITADFDFDVPARFSEDQIRYRYLAREGDQAIYELDQLACVEVRQPASLIQPLIADFNHVIDLGIDLQTVGGPIFETQISRVGGSWERRDSHWADPLGRYLLGDRSLTKAQADYFISLFRLCRGRAASFRYLDPIRGEQITVRFAEDQLAIGFDALAEEEALYTLSSLGLHEVRAVVVPTLKTYTVFIEFIPNAGSSWVGMHSRVVTAPILGIFTEYGSQNAPNDSKSGYLITGGSAGGYYDFFGGGSAFGINAAGIEGGFAISSVIEV